MIFLMFDLNRDFYCLI